MQEGRGYSMKTIEKGKRPMITVGIIIIIAHVF